MGLCAAKEAAAPRNRRREVEEEDSTENEGPSEAEVERMRAEMAVRAQPLTPCLLAYARTHS